MKKFISVLFLIQSTIHAMEIASLLNNNKEQIENEEEQIRKLQATSIKKYKEEALKSWSKQKLQFESHNNSKYQNKYKERNPQYLIAANGLFFCIFCDKCNSSQAAMEIHRGDNHRKLIKSYRTKFAPYNLFECFFCKNKYANAQILRQHLLDRHISEFLSDR